jgi:hypothetical protein
VGTLCGVRMREACFSFCVSAGSRQQHCERTRHHSFLPAPLTSMHLSHATGACGLWQGYAVHQQTPVAEGCAMLGSDVPSCI